MEFLKYGPLKAVFALLSIFALIPAAMIDAPKQAQRNVEYQNEHMTYLESEFYTDYTPVDESKIAAFDIDNAVAEGVKYNEVAFVGTHNSYQLESSEAFSKLYNSLDVLTFGIVKEEKTSFNMETLTEQLEAGIRSFEIDIETVDKDGNVSFTVCHDPLIDNTSHCYDFEKALEEIRLWSEHNPGHLPISVIIEPKTGLIPVNGMKNFSTQYAEVFDSVITEVLGDRLITPADVKGDYSSLKQMRENDGWPTLGETLGKVTFILHPTDISSSYGKLDDSAMFTMVRYADRDKSYAAFLLDNEPDSAVDHEEETVDKGFIVRTRADSFPSYSEKRYSQTDECRSQIISTDYPVRYNESELHSYSFDGYTAKIIK